MEKPVAEPIIYIDGNFEPLSVARISPLDQGFLLGDGIFDVVSAWDSKIFMLDAHLDRFFDSMRAARLETRLSRERWVDAIIETTQRNKLSDASIRFILTRGEPDGVVADPRHIQPTEMIWAAPYIFLADEEKRSTGIRIMISSMRGFAPDTLDPRFKCLDRLNSQLIRLEALEAGYDDAVWLDGHGYVAEAAASNIFVVKNDEIFTPQTGILRGITRATVLELAERGGIPHRESQLTAFDLYSADEVFTCSTAGGPLPVREVSGRAIAATGPITARISELYWQMRAEGEHSTPI